MPSRALACSARRRPAARTPLPLIMKHCEDYLQTGDTAPLLSSDLKAAMAESQLRPDLTRSQLFPFVADRPQARFGAWYEMVPRSQGKTPGQHGTFDGLHRAAARCRRHGL